MNKKLSRESLLLNMLNSTGRITTGEAVALLGVSEATARRTFTNLEKSGKIVRTYGGIQLAGNYPSYSFELRERSFRREKVEIGRLAASFVRDGDTIYLDCGTTVFQMALALSARVADGDFRSLNVITNSIANVQAIAPSPACKVVLVGGEYNSNRRDFSGSLTEKYAAPFHFTKCFLGCDGVNGQMGFTTTQFDIASLNTVVMVRSDFSYVLTDSSKFERSSLISYAALSDADGIFTDQMPEKPLDGALRTAGVRLFATGGGPAD